MSKLKDIDSLRISEEEKIKKIVELKNIIYKTRENIKNDNIDKNNNYKNLMHEINELEIELNNIKSDYYLKEKLEKYELHKHYVGKCFQLDTEFYKIISNYSSNEYRLSALKFDTNDSFYNYHIPTSSKSVDFPNLNIYLNFIDIEDIFCFGKGLGFFDYDGLKEISEEEFNKQLDLHFKKFKEKTKTISKDINDFINLYNE